MGGSLASDVHERFADAPSWGLWAHVGHKGGSLASVHHECLRALVGGTVASVGACGRRFIGCLWARAGGTVAGAPFVSACGHLWALLVLAGACGRLWAAVLRCCGRAQRSIWALALLTLLGFKPFFHWG